MNLRRKLEARAALGRPLRVLVIGAGKFGTMFLSQARLTPGLHVAAVADLDGARARAALVRAGWSEEALGAPDLEQALRTGAVFIGEDAQRLLATGRFDVAVEATGSPAAGVVHALAAFGAGTHVVMVNVEADALVGPELAREAASRSVCYSLAWGDQPALIVEQVDWARTCGFRVVAAGKGTKYLPEYHRSTPDTVWEHYGFTPEQVASGDYNPRMFNSFLDGTKSAIEMAAVANATGLAPQPGGLRFPPAGTRSLPAVLASGSRGGALEREETVEVVSSIDREGRPVPDDLRWGVYVVFEAPTDYVARCFGEYGVVTDPSGQRAALWRPSHLIGLELGVSVASVGLTGEPTGCAEAPRGDVVAVAKRDLAPGERLDGEGGYTVYGRLVPFEDSVAAALLPIGLADSLRLEAPVPAGAPVTFAHLAAPPRGPAARLRARMVERWRGGSQAPAAAATEGTARG